MNGLTFDAGRLIALDRDDRRVIALLARLNETGARVTIPSTALAHVVICARRNAEPIVTSDPDDLYRLDPKARLIVL